MAARSLDALETVAATFPDDAPEPTVIGADLTTDDGIEAVATAVRERSPEVVINNAGFGWHGFFFAHPDEILDEMVALNVRAVARLSRVAMEVMVPRGSGGLLNVASVASFVPGPSVAAYHATKAFVTSLTEGIHIEAAGTGVRVTALCPGITPTGFQRRAGTEHEHLPRLLETAPERVVRDGLRALERGDAICVPGGTYKVIVTLAKLAPRSVVRRVAGGVIARL